MLRARSVSVGPREISPSAPETPTAAISESTVVLRLDSNECASSPIDLAFPVGTEKEPPYDTYPRVVLPPPEWKEELVLPNSLPYSSLHQRSAHSIVVQMLGGRDYLWFSTGDSEDGGVYRYDQKTGHLYLYDRINGSEAYPLELFVSPEGTLWGYTIIAVHNGKDLSPLTRYEPETDSFVFVRDSLLADNDQVSTGISALTIDQQGILWVAVRREKVSIIAFSPSTEKGLREYQLEIKPIIDLETAPDGSLWLLTNEGKLYKFDVEKGQAFSYEELYKDYQVADNRELYQAMDANELLFDREGKLWISDIGWLNFSGDLPTFYRIIRSSVFINDYVRPERQYAWEHPSAIYQGTDGKFWFSGPGLVRLDPSKAEWCLLASSPSRVAEDSEGSIWAVMFSRIYRYRSAAGK